MLKRSSLFTNTSPIRGLPLIISTVSCEAVFPIKPRLFLTNLQSVLEMPGFRSLDMGEKVEFTCKKSQRGWEATKVVGADENGLKGSSVHPLGAKKQKKIR